MKGKAGRGNVAAKSKRLVNKGKTAVKKGCEWYMVARCVVTVSYCMSLAYSSSSLLAGIAEVQTAAMSCS